MKLNALVIRLLLVISTQKKVNDSRFLRSLLNVLSRTETRPVREKQISGTD